MPETYCERAIVLNRRPYRGYDYRVSFYTRERGKIDLLVKGAMRPNSRLASHVEPFTLLDLMVISGRIAYLGGAVSRDCYPNLKSDFDKITAAGKAFQRLNRLLKENVSDEKIFDLAAAFLGLLDRQTAEPVWYNWLSELFIYKIFEHLGYGLNISHCRTCRKDLLEEKEVIFSYADHSLLCQMCGASLANTVSYRLSKLKFLKKFINEPLSATVISNSRIDLEDSRQFLELRNNLLMEEIT
jgi:DNA repair protein RecO (recombination protein O)